MLTSLRAYLTFQCDSLLSSIYSQLWQLGLLSVPLTVFFSITCDLASSPVAVQMESEQVMGMGSGAAPAGELFLRSSSWRVLGLSSQQGATKGHEQDGWPHQVEKPCDLVQFCYTSHLFQKQPEDYLYFQIRLKVQIQQDTLKKFF